MLVLFGLTWRLWLGAGNFPKVPLLESLTGADLLVDWIAVALAAASALVLMTSSMRSFVRSQPPSSHSPVNTFVRTSAALFAVSLLGLFLLNQHRLQPWAWQFFLYAVFLILARRSDELILSARWLTASIYFFSAVSKFDYQFIYGLGSTMAQTLADVVGIEASEWINGVATGMPVFELLVAVLLLFTRTRKMGIILAAIFHSALIATLGPWGLGHHTGVLVWNVFFFLIATILFWPSAAEQEASTNSGLNPFLFAATIACVLYPLLPQCDHWLAWGLYSPNNSRCDLELVQENEAGEVVFQRIDLNKMSLEQLKVPIYPSARFQLGVAQAIAEKDNLSNRSRIVIKSRSNRFTGQRDSTVFNKDRMWNKGESSFFFNSKPRLR